MKVLEQVDEDNFNLLKKSPSFRKGLAIIT